MHRIKIKWALINNYSVEQKKKVQLYLFEKNGEIKYIGYCNELSLNKEIAEYLRLFKISNDEIKIWGGTISNINKQEVSRDLVESAICLMVNQMKPPLNVLCKSGYYGFGNLVVNNLSCPYMPSNLSIYNTFGRLPGAVVSV